MSCDLRGHLGYRRLPTSDPVESRLRDEWYATRKLAHETETATDIRAHDLKNEELCQYLWQRTRDLVDADRLKHPKAKRNLPVGSKSGAPDEKSGAGGRILP